MISITAQNISKAYGYYPSRWSRLKEWINPTGKIFHTNTWALRDIVLNLPTGSATAFLGANGAGKSTLLKILAGTIRATKGHYTISGNVSALLELGIGFHPDFTGRQNVYLTGQLLGLTETQLSNLMPEIAAFAEIGDYLDQPIRTYSTGMQLRLAFSVATARRPDIFLVDEALSVGDAYFQHKSFERITQFRKEGTTILLVSHEKETVLSICDNVVLMDHGQVINQGKPQPMLDLYNALTAAKLQNTISIEQAVLDGGAIQTLSGTLQAQVSHIFFLDEHGARIDDSIPMGEKIILEIAVHSKALTPELNVGFGIKNIDGEVVFGTNTYCMGAKLLDLLPKDSKRFQFAFPMDICPGKYSISTALVGGISHIEKNYEWKDFAHQFEVTNPLNKKFEGQVWLSTTAKTS